MTVKNMIVVVKQIGKNSDDMESENRRPSRCTTYHRGAFAVHHCRKDTKESGQQGSFTAPSVCCLLRDIQSSVLTGCYIHCPLTSHQICKQVSVNLFPFL